MKRPLLFLHWLNVDTALGAVITSKFIAISLGSTIPEVALATLFIAVLSIYNFDHLMDARKINTIAISARHRFYQANQRGLSIYQLLLMLILITIIWYLPDGILRAGLILALFTAIYFILLFFIFPKHFLLKEIMISVVYSLALFLAPVYASQTGHIDIQAILLWLEIVCLAVANTLIFAWYDHEIDIKDGHTSLAASMGKNYAYFMVVGVMTILMVLVAIQLFTKADLIPQLIIVIMGATLLVSLLANRVLSINERYRILGDAVFVIPALIFLL